MSIIKFNNKLIRFNNKLIQLVNYNPLNLPANTIRVRTNDGNAPIKDTYTTYETATLVQGTSDVYDVYKSGTTFGNLLYHSTNVIEVLGANTTGITNMEFMFAGCWDLVSVPLFDTSKVVNMDCMFTTCESLTAIPLFDTSNVTIMSYMCNGCYSITSLPLFDTSNVSDMYYAFSNCIALTAIPLFDTSKITRMSYMFSNCRNVQSGALALYQQASSQTTPPTSHVYTFYNCGSSTTQGAAELAQIPAGWK